MIRLLAALACAVTLGGCATRTAAVGPFNENGIGITIADATHLVIGEDRTVTFTSHGATWITHVVATLVIDGHQFDLHSAGGRQAARTYWRHAR